MFVVLGIHDRYECFGLSRGILEQNTGFIRLAAGWFGTLKRTESLSRTFYGRRYVGSDRGLEAAG